MRLAQAALDTLRGLGGRLGQGPAVVTLIAGLAVTVGLTAAIRSLEQQRIRNEFEHEAAILTAEVQERLNDVMAELASINRLVEAVPQLRRGQFDAYARPVLDAMPQIELLAWRRIPAQGEADYSVARSASARQAGFDGATGAEQEQAARRACASGRAVMTGRYQVARGERTRPGFTVLMPVYRGDAQQQPACERVEGYTVAAVDSATLVEQALGELRLGPGASLDVEVYQDNQAKPSALVYGRREVPRPAAPLADLWGAQGRYLATSFAVGGRQWHVVVRGAPEPLLEHSLGSFLMFLLGSAGSVLAAASVGKLSARERGVARLVRERTAALTHANASLQLQRQAIEACINGIVIASAEGGAAIEYVNPAFSRLTGYGQAEVLGRGLDVLWGGDSSAPGAAELHALVREQREGNVVLRARRKDGAELWFSAHIAPCRDAAGTVRHFVVAHYDVTDKHRYEAELHHQATHDTLTGLANRALLAERLRQEVAAAARHGYALWVLFVDLDRFKQVNDSLGHQAGDELLRTVSQRLLAAVRPEDTVARPGGDEFVLVLAERGDGHLSAGMVGRIMDAVARPVAVQGNECFINASIGIACYPQDGADPEALIACADMAMYRAKQLGRNNYQFYLPEMNDEARQRLHTERALRCAIERGEFELHYQAQLDLQTGRVAGAEALLRWRHPELGLLEPARFMPAAEDTGLALPIGEWAMRTACAQVRAWQLAGHAELRLALDIGARQFREPGLVAQVTGVLAETGLAPALFELELTERMVMDDVERAVAVLGGLRALGVGIALDDFGTGYSSLAQLRRFPLDALKIDESFVRTLAQPGHGAAIPDAIIALAHSLGMRVVAEGVGTEAQCIQLAAGMCDEIQGAVYSEPLDAAAFGAALAAGRALPGHLLRMQKRQRTLLLVDDEPNILAALKRQLRGAGLRILTAQGGKEGLELLASEQVDVIVSDQRMPGMTGVEFLRAVKHSHPDTVRMVLSGFTELQSVTDAVNEGAIYKFLTKPWDDAQIRAHILEAFRQKEMADENRRLDLAVRKANQGLAQANRQLEEVLRQQEEQISHTGISLAIVREALHQVPMPILGLDEDKAVAFANLAARHLFRGAGELLGSPVDWFMPELAAIEEGRPHLQAIGGVRFHIAAHAMGRGTSARGAIIIFNPAGPDNQREERHDWQVQADRDR